MVKLQGYTVVEVIEYFVLLVYNKTCIPITYGGKKGFHLVSMF